VTELTISLERSASMTESETRDWIVERAGQLTLPFRGLDGSGSDALLLRIEVDGYSTQTALMDLMMDMRLLGLQPTLLSAGPDAKDGYQYR
jgi:hypothetical protein